MEQRPSNTQERPAPSRAGEGVADWARRRQRETEASLSSVERIELALTLGLRSRALRALGPR